MPLGKCARCLVDFAVVDAHCRPRRMCLGSQLEPLWIIGRVALLDGTQFSEIVQAGHWKCPTLDELHRSATSIWMNIPVRNLRLDGSVLFRAKCVIITWKLISSLTPGQSACRVG
jgi:hypothetical protein